MIEFLQLLWKRIRCKHCWHLERGPASKVLRLRCCECDALDYSPHIQSFH